MSQLPPTGADCDTPAIPVLSEQNDGVASILDRLDALVYVSDMQTYELLYLNEYGRSVWGDYRGRTCWQVLQAGQEGPCHFCSNGRLLDAQGQPAGAYVWEFQNTANGHWYQCRDQAIHWPDGRIVRLEIATDITARKRIEEELHLAVARAEALARTDELTGLNNRRAFFELGEALFQSSRLGSLAVVMCDVDRFKQVNDTSGHAIGDELLRSVGAALLPLVRPGDVLGRLGGEEFAVILADTSLEQAVAIAERLRMMIESVRVADGGRTIRCTASFGVSARNDATCSLDALLSEADHALFQAKRMGRNRVVASGSGLTQRNP